MTRARVFTAALVAALAVALGGAALAQYPIGGVDDCAETFDGGGNETTTFAPGGDIQLQGQEGCADDNERGIEAFLESDPVLLARFEANPDGSYVSPVATIPSDTTPGRHEVVVQTEDNEYVQPITVTGAGVPSGLPETGRDIALLALWGTLSLVLGTVLVTVTWRHWREARVMADAESAWASEASALGTLDEREAAPYRPQAIEWTDAPRTGEDLESPVDLESTAELEVIDVPEIELAAEWLEEPAPVEDPAPEPVFEPEPVVEPEPVAAVQRASTRTSEIIEELRRELDAWKR